MKNLAIISVAFQSNAYGDQYIRQQERLKESIEKHCPDADLFFWTDEYPPGSKPFLESLYGFKAHAIHHVFKLGYTRILYLDTAMVIERPIDCIFDHEFIAVRDETKLHTCISDKFLVDQFIDRSIVEDMKLHLVGGSLYYFDFNNLNTCRLFWRWLDAEEEGFFGSQEEESSGQLQGHRHDEACMALIMSRCGAKTTEPHEIGYCTADNPVFVKKHFK